MPTSTICAAITIFLRSTAFFARYSLRNQFRNQAGTLPYPAMGGQGQTVDLKGHNIVGNLSSTLRPTVFNELRFGFSEFDTAFDIPFTENLNPQFGILNAPGDTFTDRLDQGWTRFSPAGYVEMGPRSFWPNINNLTNYLISNSTLWQIGRHTLKVGGRIPPPQCLPRLLAFPSRTVCVLRGLHFGTAERGHQSRQHRERLRRHAARMGVRRHIRQQSGRKRKRSLYRLLHSGRLEDNPQLHTQPRSALGSLFRGMFPNADQQTVSRYLLAGINVPTLADERIVFPKDGGDCGCKNDLNNFAPRIGFAWSLNDKTVIRSGAGMFYGEPNNLSTDGANFRSGPPRQLEIGIQTSFERTGVFVQDGFPPYAISGDVPAGSTVYAFPDLRQNLSAGQWFFDIQRTLPFETLVTVGYMGTSGTHLASTRNVNLPMTPSVLPVNQRYIRPQFNNVTFHDNMLNSSYNALTAKVEKRFSKGLTFLSSFTWSKNIDQGGEDLLNGDQGPVTPWDLSRERSLSTLHREFAYVFSSVYELPFGKGRRYLTSGPGRWLFGGWQVGGLLSLLSGMPLGHTINVNNQNLGGSVRGDYVRSPNLPSDQRNIDQWFDIGFVVPSAPGVTGNAGRNLIIGPGAKTST